MFLHAKLAKEDVWIKALPWIFYLFKDKCCHKSEKCGVNVVILRNKCGKNVFYHWKMKGNTVVCAFAAEQQIVSPCVGCPLLHALWGKIVVL